MSSATDGWTRHALALSVALGQLSCGGGSGAAASADAGGADGCFVGDRSAEAEVELVYRTADGELRSVEESGTIPLIQPPQGGKVLFVGVKARNVDGCNLMLATALIDPDTEEVVSLERRPVTLEASDDGWLLPERADEASNYSNLPACPRAGLVRSIEGEKYELRVHVSDASGRKVEKSVQVVPTCGEPSLLDLCRCECSKDYRLGGECGSHAEVAP